MNENKLFLIWSMVGSGVVETVCKIQNNIKITISLVDTFSFIKYKHTKPYIWLYVISMILLNVGKIQIQIQILAISVKPFVNVEI